MNKTIKFRITKEDKFRFKPETDFEIDKSENTGKLYIKFLNLRATFKLSEKIDKKFRY